MSSVQDPRPQESHLVPGRRARQSLAAGAITLLLAWRVLGGDWSTVSDLGANIALLMAGFHMLVHGLIVTVLRAMGGKSAAALAEYLHPHTLSQRDLSYFWLAVLLVARHL